MTRRLLPVAGAVAAVAFILVLGAQGLSRVLSMTREVERLERVIDRLRGETDALSAEISRLRTDPATIEREAREQLGMVRPGERVLKLPPATDGR